ncbi:MAG: lamin tail domain-containing protein [Bacillota bacterium]
MSYTFPNGTILPPAGYLVITENPAQFQRKFNKTALGPWTGSLSNEGDDIELCNSAGGKLDEVDYKMGFPWPTVGDTPGYSIELINPDFDNSLGGNWRSAGPSGPTKDITLFSSGSTWHYRKGDTEASNPIGAWRQRSFTEDSSWFTGTGPIGYDNNAVLPGSPNLAQMRTDYTSVFLRKTFTVSDPSQFSSLRLEAMYDDGFNVWINGKRVAFANVAGEDLKCTDTSIGGARESNNYDTFVINSPEDVLVAGTNVIAVQFFNIYLNSSSDAFFDARLIASMGGSGTSPTPAKKNSDYATNAPPQMRQVSNTPQQPKSNEPVFITAKITDPEGVANVSLSYQLVDPGNYFSLDDAAYYDPNNWHPVAMNDSGIDGDAVAGDGIYTAMLPASLQMHRRLVRYRITATDNLGASVTAPYADDPQPNFAYYCYDGMPTWSAAIQPGSTDPTKKQVVTYDFNAMPYMPVYQLLTKKQSHLDSQALPGSTQGQYWGDAYLWSGTLVYDGVVYDHVHYRARGGVWRYSMGKNMWKFDFNRGHEFQPKDEYGNPLSTTWKKLNLSANIQQGDFGQRGEQGLFEYLGFKLFDLAGVPAPTTFPIHFRIVENASETNNTASQYDDDFQGMYMAIEQQDGNFLDEHDLPDGNIYKMESGPGGGESNNQGPTQPSDNSDLINFTNTYRYSTTTDQWWRDNLDLNEYYNYRAIVEAIHHWDIGFGKNYFYYHNPETNKWEVMPWDLDLTWTTTYEPGGGDAEPFKQILSRSTFSVEYKNRLREIRDLLFNSDQIGQLIDEYVAMVDSPSPGASMVDADRAMWDYNPIMSSSYVNPDKAGVGRFYQAAPTKDFRGMAQRLKTYVTNRSSYLDNIAADSLIPNKPTASYVGAAGYPVDGLTFRSSAFSDSTGTFAAMKWRIVEVNAPGDPAYDPNAPRKSEIDATWESPELTTFNSNITIPATIVEDGKVRTILEPGKYYRVRVRMKDSTGRWSKWSDAVQFMAGAGSTTIADSLRITELHYDPAAPAEGSPYTKDDFEFVELTNIGPQPINLNGVSFVNGITFTFGNMELAPGQQVVVVKNLDAFKLRYRTEGMNIAGVYSGSLKDSGEQIKLVDSAGQTILDFTYDSDWHSTTNGDGDSLVIADPNAPTSAWGQASGWKASRISGGTPGVEETSLAKDSIVVNEILAHTDAEAGDWVEFYNTTDSPIDLSGWWLSDESANPTKYQIQPGTVIPAHGFIVFSQFAQFDKLGAPGVVTPFAFSELGGDEVVLSSATSTGLLTGYRTKEKVEASDREVTLGRILTSDGIDFTALSRATPNAANAGPMVGPVVINELMYDPALGGDEFVELRNISNNYVSLFDPLVPADHWKFTAGITYEFPGYTTLSPDEYILVVPIDPALFRSKYNIPQAIRIFGPYTGSLDNSGETITLSRPGDPEQLDGTVPYYAVDRVHYNNVAPWPTEAYGTGPALGRRIGGDYGNDPANWAATASGGTPGRANFNTKPPTADIVDVTPDPRNSGVDSITIQFSQKITGFELSDLVLTRNGSPVAFSGDQTLTSSDGLTWTLNNLSGLTLIEGNYTLTLAAANSSIMDLAGNALAEDASDSFEVTTTVIPGSPGNDTYILRRSGDMIQVFVNPLPNALPTYTIPASLPHRLTIDAGDGDDNLVIDQSGGSAIPGGAMGLVFSGGSGSGDSISILGNGTSVGSYFFTGNVYVLTIDGQKVYFDSESLSISDFSSFAVNGSNGNDNIQIDAPSADHGRISGSGANVPFTPLTYFNTAKTIVDTGDQGQDVVTLAGNIPGNLEINFGQDPSSLIVTSGTQDLGSRVQVKASNLTLRAKGDSIINLSESCSFATLGISESARVNLLAGSNKVLTVSKLEMTDNGKLDLANNSLIVHATPDTRNNVLTDVSNQIKAARNSTSQLWQGNGITSSTAAASSLRGLAVLLNDQGDGTPILNTLGTVPVTTDDILVKYTWDGDVDLNGQVDGDDYFLIDSGFISGLDQYRNGDVDLNGVIDGDDYFLVDSAFIGQSNVSLSPLLSSGSLRAPLAAQSSAVSESGAIQNALIQPWKQTVKRLWDRPRHPKVGRDIDRRSDPLA